MLVRRNVPPVKSPAIQGFFAFIELPNCASPTRPFSPRTSPWSFSSFQSFLSLVRTGILIVPLFRVQSLVIFCPGVKSEKDLRPVGSTRRCCFKCHSLNLSGEFRLSAQSTPIIPRGPIVLDAGSRCSTREPRPAHSQNPGGG